jgi:large subunit ribosomal protein L10
MCVTFFRFSVKGWHFQPAGLDSFPANWSMLVDRAEKREFVSTLQQIFTDSGVIVVAHYSGLTVSQLSALRRKMSQAGGSVRVAKNRLVKIALNGTEIEHVSPLFNGPTILAYSEDPIVAPKVAVEFAKSHDKFVILGGAMGATSLNADAVKNLATLPSLDELRAKLIGLVQAPATKIAQVVTAPSAKLARVFGAYAAKDAA